MCGKWHGLPAYESTARACPELVEGMAVPRDAHAHSKAKQPFNNPKNSFIDGLFSVTNSFSCRLLYRQGTFGDFTINMRRFSGSNNGNSG
jgi:hypothetical protein